MATHNSQDVTLLNACKTLNDKVGKLRSIESYVLSVERQKMQIEVDLIGRVPMSESLYEFLHRAAAVATYHDNAVEQVVSIVCISNDTLAVYYRRKDAPGG